MTEYQPQDVHSFEQVALRLLEGQNSGLAMTPSGGSASFSKLDDTSVRSILGTRTLSIMRQFIEDAEKDGEEEGNGHQF